METIYLSCIEIYASSHCIDNGFGLLKNLFLHECGISSFHYLLDFHLKGCNLASHWVTILMVIYELCTKFSQSFFRKYLLVRHILYSKSYLSSKARLTRWIERTPFETAATSSSSKKMTLFVCSMIALASLAKKYSTCKHQKLKMISLLYFSK